ncbi:MAG TPA: alpha/beta hydrolase [Nitrososphaerales archaeon]|nr:alpha/beta hydrolase [Nitrososphaerales archaeon]
MQATERVLEVGEFRVNCATAGKGKNVLLLHGSDHRENWRVWEPLLPLGDAYSLVMPDMIGYGKSSLPEETPDYASQADTMRDLLERVSVEKTAVIGTGWGGQVALELALKWPSMVEALVLISSSYDKEQLPRLQKLRRPALIIYAEDDMVTQLKAGYLLRDAIGTSRLEILGPVAYDPTHDFTISHKLQKFRTPQVLQLVRLFLSNPAAMIAEPPQMEDELRGMAMRKKQPEEGSQPI